MSWIGWRLEQNQVSGRQRKEVENQQVHLSIICTMVAFGLLMQEISTSLESQQERDNMVDYRGTGTFKWINLELSGWVTWKQLLWKRQLSQTAFLSITLFSSFVFFCMAFIASFEARHFDKVVLFMLLRRTFGAQQTPAFLFKAKHDARLL